MLKSAARSPILHFVLIGGLLYGGERLSRRDRPAAASRAPIVITAERLRQLESDYMRETGRPPTRAQLEGLVDQAVEDEFLYREARLERLDQGDRRIQLRLVQKMRAVSDDRTLDEEHLYQAALTLGFDDDLVVRRLLQEKMRLILASQARVPPPSETELQAYLEAHASAFEMAAATSFTHVFLSARVHGPRLGDDAAAMAASLRASDLAPERAAALSDPFPLGLEVKLHSQEAIARQFGDAFARAIEALPPGRWSVPIRSPFGVHIVRLSERRSAQLPPLESVRRRVQIALQQERTTSRLRAALDRLRERYFVRIEWDEFDRSIVGTAP
jgi:parvulin-like peptidyl-prolyl isomerase